MNDIYFINFYIICTELSQENNVHHVKRLTAETNSCRVIFITIEQSPAVINMKNRISVIIPVYHEAQGINRTLLQFSRISRNTAHEIIVVDGDREGGTIRSISDPFVKTTVAPKGRAVQMNHGAMAASGDILLFLHADTILPANALALIQSTLFATATAYGAFELGIASDKPVYRLIEATVRIRTRVTGIPYGDQAVFLTKDVFDRAGGYPEIPIMEDVALMRRLKKRKAGICIIPEKVYTSPRRWESEGIVRCTLRNWLLATCFLLGASPEKLAKYYKTF